MQGAVRLAAVYVAQAPRQDMGQANGASLGCRARSIGQDVKRAYD